jgi:hypothetical protein
MEVGQNRSHTTFAGPEGTVCRPRPRRCRPRGGERASEAGFAVTGVEIPQHKADALKTRPSYSEDVPDDVLHAALVSAGTCIPRIRRTG